MNINRSNKEKQKEKKRMENKKIICWWSGGITFVGAAAIVTAILVK